MGRTADELLRHQTHALPLLVGGARDLPQRQQTLRGTIAWSYELLGGGAARLPAVCSVFRGGISLEAVESVCGAAIDLGVEVLDGLEVGPLSDRPVGACPLPRRMLSG